MTNTENPRALLLCGMKGCGKSYYAHLLSRCGFTAFDTDEEMAAILGGRSVRSFYLEAGESEFRRIEALCLEGIFSRLESAGARRYVIATGGGLAANDDALRLISRRRPLVAYLRADPRLLYERALEKGLPAYLTDADPWSQFLSIERKRDGVYSKICDFVLELSNYGDSQAVVRRLEEMI